MKVERYARITKASLTEADVESRSHVTGKHHIIDGERIQNDNMFKTDADGALGTHIRLRITQFLTFLTYNIDIIR